MPTNILSPKWMNDTLNHEFSNVKKLGFTAEGVNKIFHVHSRNEKNFKNAVKAISSNEKLIEAIYKDCSGIDCKNLENILRLTGHGCAAVIEKLHGHRSDIDDSMKKVKFSGGNISGMISGSFAAAITGLDAVVNKKRDFQTLIDSGFSVNSISSVLKNTGTSINDGVQTLIDNLSKLDDLKKIGFSVTNICVMLGGSGTRLKYTIQVLIKNQVNFEYLMSLGFSANNISSMLSRRSANLNVSIQALIDSSSKLEILKKSGFSASNISSMLSRSGANLNVSIQALIDNSSKFDSLKKIGFSEKNISSMVCRSGASLIESVPMLIKNQANFEYLLSIGFLADQISSLLNTSGVGLSRSIPALIKHSDFFLGSLQSGQRSATDLRPELRKYAAQISESINSAQQVEQAAEVVAAADPAGSSIDEFVADLAGLLLLAPNCSGDQFLPATEALVKHRNALLQLHTWCGFSANHIAGILNHSEANLGKAIGELSGKATLLFGLIQEGHFTAGELAEKLHGSGDNVGVVFGKDPTIRAALHASHRDLNGKRAASATVQENDWFNDAQFFEVDDSDMSLLGLSSDDQSWTSQAAKRPRVA